ncbi:MAG: hypothetical protein DRJ63_09745 [Thermoprotei archaeon]|nr:MAG: hypothetical protein DRJ63_09745 [Thermoprotei archaeon]
MNGEKCEKMFEGAAHPLRIEILRALAEKPMTFSELKKELGIKSSGHLDFHLKKLEGLIEVKKDGKYHLTKEGYAALEALKVASKYGWQKRALLINIIAYTVFNIVGAYSNFDLWLKTVFPLTTLWLIYYLYWAFKKRKLHKWW